jgi:hypothetical protein
VEKEIVLLCKVSVDGLLFAEGGRLIVLLGSLFHLMQEVAG